MINYNYKEGDREFSQKITMDKKNINYNQKALFENEIMSLVQEIKKKCVLNKIPCFVCAAVANNAKKTEYIYDGVLTGTLGINLTDDKFSKHLCVANGFEIKAPGVADTFSDVSDFVSQNNFNDVIQEIPQDL